MTNYIEECIMCEEDYDFVEKMQTNGENTGLSWHIENDSAYC